MLIQFSREKLKLTSDFPAHNVLIRNPVGEPVRSLYLTNDMVKSVILHNDYNRIRLISCGTKVFVKQEGKSGLESQFRILGEGLPVVMPFVRQDSVLEGGTGTLKTLLQTLYPLTNTFEEPFKQIIENKGSDESMMVHNWRLTFTIACLTIRSWMPRC
jgi:multisite-specific tRNA:(cytosine-C5)-methyltransferase